MRRTGKEGLHERLTPGERAKQARSRARSKAVERPSLIPESMLADFEAKHGTVVVVRKTASENHPKPARPTASAEFGELLRRHPALHGAEVVGEHEFHPTRGWRFDWCLLGPKLAIEIEGWGRHQTYTGYRGDCEKYNAAILHGWRVLRFMAGEREHMAEWVDTTIRALCGVDDG